MHHKELMHHKVWKKYWWRSIQFHDVCTQVEQWYDELKLFYFAFQSLSFCVWKTVKTQIALLQLALCLIKRWKCQLRSLAQAQSGISVCLLQNRQFGWSPCAWSLSNALCVEETNRSSFSCSLPIFWDA